MTVTKVQEQNDLFNYIHFVKGDPDRSRVKFNRTSSSSQDHRSSSRITIPVGGQRIFIIIDYKYTQYR